MSRRFNFRNCAIVLAIFAAGSLASCGSEEPEEEVKESDPLTMRSLNDPLMIDTELESQSMDESAFAFEVGKPIPKPIEDSATIIEAQQEAIRITGGSVGSGMMPSASGSAEMSEADSQGALGRALRLSGASGCAKNANYSNAWAAKMPTELQLYPYANMHEGLGIESDACHLRSIVYRSFAPKEDILGFHYAMATKAGYQTEVLSGGDWTILRGTKGGRNFEVSARSLKGNLNEIGIAYLSTAR